MQVPILAGEFDRDGFRSGVAHDISQRLLGNAKALRFDNWVQPLVQRFALEIGAHSGQCCLPLSEPAQRWFQSEIIEHGGTQIQRQIVNLLENAFDRLDAVFKPSLQGRRARGLQSRLQVHFRGGEALPDLVVELACNLPPFRLLHLNQPMRQDL